MHAIANFAILATKDSGGSEIEATSDGEVGHIKYTNHAISLSN